MSSTQEKLGSILDANDSKMASFSAIIWHKGEGRAAKREWQKRRQETIDDLTTLIDSAKREGAIEELKKLPANRHESSGWCNAEFFIDSEDRWKRIAQLEQSEESE